MKKANTSYIFFDGYCNLCNASVDFIVRRDRKRSFYYASLQGDTASKILADKPELHGKDSIVLLENGKVYTESSAVLRISLKMSALWPLMSIFLIVPKFIRDGVYRFVARNRYKWFGKRDTCRVPTEEESHQFLP